MALYRNKVLVSGIRDYPAMTWAEYQALPVAQRPKKWICTDRDYTEIPDVFYKDVAIAGVTVTSYWAEVDTGVYGDYTAIGFQERGTWDEKLNFECGAGTSTTTIKLHIRCTQSSYTVPSNRGAIRVFFVKTGRITALT